MDNSEQFRNEINSLFETVKKQALEYSNAFQSFRIMQNEFQEITDRINALKTELSRDYEIKSQQYDLKIQEFLDHITIEHDELEKEYKLVKNVNELNDQQEKLVNKLKKFVDDSKIKLDEIISNINNYQTDFENLKNRVHDDAKKLLEDLTLKFESKIEKTIDEKTDKLKEDIIFRQRKIEGLLKSTDKDIKILQREFTSTRIKYNEDIEEIKLQIGNEDPAAKTDNKSLIDNLNYRMDEMNSLLDENMKKVEKLNDTSDDNIRVSDSNSTYNMDKSMFLSINKRLKDFEVDMNDVDKKVKTAYIIAFMSIVFALISIVITFI